jgi:hypothetical protein
VNTDQGTYSEDQQRINGNLIRRVGQLEDLVAQYNILTQHALKGLTERLSTLENDYDGID